MCFISVLSKASKEPLQTAKRLVWQLTAAPELCVNLKIFYLEVFFVFFSVPVNSCWDYITTALNLNRSVPSDRSGRRFLTLQFCCWKAVPGWWSETRGPLYEGSTDSEKKNKKCPFTIAKKKNKIKIKWNSFFSFADFDPSEKQQLKSRAGANFQGMWCRWQPDSVMCNYENTSGINGRIYWPTAQ